MQIFKGFLKAAATSLVVLTAMIMSVHFIGELWTNTILLILIIICIVFSFQLGLHEKKKIELHIEKEDIDIDGVAEFMENYGRIAKMGYMSLFKSDNEQPSYAELNAEQQVMKSEENELRTRLAETIKFKDSDTFKSWEEKKQNALLRQIGAMSFYHLTILTRCSIEGVLLPKEGTSSSDGQDSSSSSPDDSSSDDNSSSSGTNSSSSSDNSDSSGSSDSSSSSSSQSSSSSSSSHSSSSDY